MSSTKRQYLTSSDLKLLDGVLAAAGMHDQHADPAKRLVRRKAARYLISRFQEGARSPEALANELDERPRALPMERKRAFLRTFSH